MTDFDLTQPETHSISELANALQSKSISSMELTQLYLDRAEQLDSKINAFTSFTKEAALATAQQADAKISDGNNNFATGIPIAHKDLFCTLEGNTTCASKFLENYQSPFESTVTQKTNELCLPMLGKLNMDEFAMGSSTENSFFGPTKNPWHLDYVPGGSSGGSAAAVAASLTPWSTGTDTGGSIRQPAAFCGISGIKPTYGRVSRWGMVAFASSLDQAGPMGKRVEDIAHLLNIISGFDAKDSTSSQQATEDYNAGLAQDISGMTIGLPKEYFSDQLDSNIATAIDAAKSELIKAGANFVEISLPSTDAAIAAYYVIASAEASTNLSRFDGVRFGHRSDKTEDLESLYKHSRAEGFGEEVKRRILTGTFALSAGYYDAYYLKAQKVRRLVLNEFKVALKNVDAILTPITPTPAFQLGQKQDPVTMYQNDIFSITANLAGLPALALPCGFAEGLPVGFQLLGDHFTESRLLNIGHQYQQLTAHHLARPTALV
jgi:aspartyl-tRNA(Asn)/glutamyl-tRNA(Gln) amidotransferase subunit A